MFINRNRYYTAQYVRKNKIIISNEVEQLLYINKIFILWNRNVNDTEYMSVLWSM